MERTPDGWTPDRWTAVFVEQAALFRAAVSTADPAAPVPSCPGWTFADLTTHVGRFLAQVTRYLASGSLVRLRPTPAEPVADPVAFLDTELASATQVLTTTPGNRPVWTFSPAAPDLARVWHRRAAHELNLRRWDAQAARRTLVPTDPEQATDAVDELLTTLLAAKQAQDAPPRWSGTALVSVTDGPAGWFVRLAPGEVPAVRAADPADQADARLTGRAENVLYQLRDRMQLTGTGDRGVLRALRLG